MFNIEHFKELNKEDFYESLLFFAKGLMEDERDVIANLSNVSSLLFNTMNQVNWAGFYIKKKNQLVLGPFNGKPACIRIRLGKGVCGVAAETGVTQLVMDVHEFPGHIACDGDTKSEIVIPIRVNNQVLGVLDIDSPKTKRFNDDDKIKLEELVHLIEESCEWEVYNGI